ncbi:MAG: FIST C-terminal domain-containing protein [Schwartzia sp.]|nr:FIST C-terminal domain-containing protein [Schwartzia sp. (in: firmicutes)]
MDSIALYTEEIDDLAEAAEELFTQARAFAFRKHSIALLFAEEELDFSALFPLLAEKWQFPIVGCTAMGMLGRGGYFNIGISVLLLSADDCAFAAEMTGALDTGNYREEIARTCRALRDRLPDAPKLILTYGGLLAAEKNVAGDDVVEAITEVAGKDVPVFGGLASDGFSFTGSRVFCDGRSAQNGQLLVLVSGAVEPKFVTINSIENRANFSYEVTEARHNQVFRLGSGTFLEALEREDMAVDKTEVLGDYLLTPFVLTLTRENGDSVEVARNFSRLDHETGAGAFLGAVPEGSILGVGIISRADVQKSVRQAFDRIFEEIGAAGGKYKTLLCHSCCARFLALASNTKEETDAYVDRLPDGIALVGMYAYGEYCPVKGNKTGESYNSFHNFTFTIMAL